VFLGAAVKWSLRERSDSGVKRWYTYVTWGAIISEVFGCETRKIWCGFTIKYNRSPIQIKHSGRSHAGRGDRDRGVYIRSSVRRDLVRSAGKGG
jgi:hypothetical protein